MNGNNDYSAYASIIRERVPALTIGEDFGLNVGSDGRCPCVFCTGDRKDTLRLYSGNRGFYCFRCHANGDVISLYQQITGSGFRKAIEDLNSQYGIGLDLKNGSREQAEKARAEAERRRLEREEQKRKEDELFIKYLDAADAVQILEQIREKLAPATPADFTQRFVISLKYLDELRDYRDRIYDEMCKNF